MTEFQYDAFRGWPGGVVSSGRSERNPRSSAFHGYNSYLTNINASGATPTTRPGFIEWSQTKTHAGGVKAQIDYVFQYNTTTYVNYHVTIGDNGRIDIMEFGTGPANVATGVFTGTSLPSSAIANELCFIVDEVAKKKLRTYLLENFGIVRPASVASASATGSGVMTGTYEVRYTYYNGNTGHESSASDSSTAAVLSGQQLAITGVTVSSDAQVTARKVYIRDTTSQTLFRYAGQIANNSGTTITLNVDETLLLILAPSTTENAPPPSSVKHLAYVNSYMFAASDKELFWSKKGQPEAFDETFIGEPVGKGDGQIITGLFGFGEVLLVFKTRSTYILTGSSPLSWKLLPLFSDIGCVSHKSITVASGSVWWWSHLGPVSWDGTNLVQLGKLLLNLNSYPHPETIQVAVEEDLNLVLWTHPGTREGGAGRNTEIVAFHAERGIVVSDKWDGMDACSLASITTSSTSRRRQVFLGNYNGQVFCFNQDRSDGFPGGTQSGTFIPGAASITTITASGFYTSGEKLIERYVTVVDSGGLFVGRRRITTNTSTVLTLDIALDVTVGETYTFYIAAPNFEWHTVHEDSDKPFLQKKYHKGYLAMEVVSNSVADDVSVQVDTYTDKSTEFNVPKRTAILPVVFDDSEDTYKARYSIGAVGNSWCQIISSRAPEVIVTILEVQVKSELLTDNLG